MTTYVFAYYHETDSLKLVGEKPKHQKELPDKLMGAYLFDIEAESERAAWPLAASYAKQLQ